MPVVKHKGKKFLLRWKPEWDALVLKIVKTYKNPNGRVDWQRARKDGALKGLPMRFEAVRMRPTWLARYKNRKWLKEDRKRARESYAGHNWKKEKARLSIIKEIPNDLVRPKWTKAQIRTLKSLAKKHRRGKLTDWTAVLNDPRTFDLPGRNPLDLSGFLSNLNHEYSYGKYLVTREKRLQYMRKFRKKVKARRALVREFLYKKLNKGEK